MRGYTKNGVLVLSRGSKWKDLDGRLELGDDIQ